jgi:hypothetical protein
MIEWEADRDRKSPRPLAPEVVEARIELGVAELRVLAARTSILAARAQELHHVPTDIWFASKTDVARAIVTAIAKRKAEFAGGWCAQVGLAEKSQLMELLLARRGARLSRPEGRCGSAASPGGAAQLLAASLPLRSYIRFASKRGRKFTALLSVAKCQQRPLPLFAERKIMECETRLRHSPLTFAAIMIGVQRAISLLTSTASGC